MVSWYGVHTCILLYCYSRLGEANTHAPQTHTMKLIGDCGYSRDDIQCILDAPIPFGGDDEVALTEKLFALLNEEQVEAAAQASYAYWLATLSKRPPTKEEQIKMAKRECRRHVVKRAFERASKDILETLQYRQVSREKKNNNNRRQVSSAVRWQRATLSHRIIYVLHTITTTHFLLGTPRRFNESLFSERHGTIQ